MHRKPDDKYPSRTHRCTFLTLFSPVEKAAEILFFFDIGRPLPLLHLGHLSVDVARHAGVGMLDVQEIPLGILVVSQQHVGGGLPKEGLRMIRLLPERSYLGSSFYPNEKE
jgi:hypothetical protein